VSQERIGSAGAWLKSQERLKAVTNNLRLLASELKEGARY